MAVIKEYTAPLADTGIKTNVYKAMNAEQTAVGAAKSGREQGSALAAAGREIGSGIDTLGKGLGADYTAFVVQPEIARGAADLASITDDLTKTWNATAKNADLNDPNVAQKFREDVLAPTLDKFKDSFGTGEGQQFAERSIEKLRSHMFEKTAADMTTRAGLALTQNLDTLKNSMSQTVANDPTSLQSSLAMMKGSIKALVNASPNLSADQAATVETSLTTHMTKELAKGAFVGAVDKNAEQAPKLLDDPIYRDNFSATELEQFKRYAGVKQKTNAMQAQSDRFMKGVQAAARAHALASQQSAKLIQPDGSLKVSQGYFDQSFDVLKNMGDAKNSVPLAHGLLALGQRLQREQNIEPGTDSYYEHNMGDANAALNLTPQEQALYQRHLTNLYGPGGTDNADGTRSTLYQAVQEHDGKFYNIPTVWNGKREVEKFKRKDGTVMDVPNKTALANVEKEGWDKFPSYNTPEEADARYAKMHEYMEKDTEQYQKSLPVPPPTTNPHVDADFGHRLTLNDNDPNKLALKDVLQARADGQIDDRTFGYYHNLLNSPIPLNVLGIPALNSFLREYTPKISGATASQPTGPGAAQAVKFTEDVRDAFLQGRNDGISIHDLLDHKNPRWIGRGMQSYMIDAKANKSLLLNSPSTPTSHPAVKWDGKESMDHLLARINKGQ